MQMPTELKQRKSTFHESFTVTMRHEGSESFMNVSNFMKFLRLSFYSLTFIKACKPDATLINPPPMIDPSGFPKCPTMGQ